MRVAAFAWTRRVGQRDARKAFLLNVYNIGVKHAYANVGIPRTTRERLAFYGGVGYVIGGDFYSLDDIEHGLLRAIAAYPSTFSVPSTLKTIERPNSCCRGKTLGFISRSTAARTRVRPSERTPRKIESQLELAAQAFVNGTVVVDKAASRVTMSKLLSWYARISDERERCARVHRRASEG